MHRTKRGARRLDGIGRGGPLIRGGERAYGRALMEQAGARAAFVDLVAGDPMPRFFQERGRERRFAWDAMAGRYLLFCPFLSDEDALGRSALEAIAREARRFD